MGAAFDVAIRFFEALGRGELDGADVLFADDCTFEMPPGRMTKAEHRQMGDVFLAGLPDARMVVDHHLGDGDEVYIEGRFQGTHTGDLVSPQGTVAASGNSLDLRFADYFRVAAGRIVVHRSYWDQLDMMGQLGAAP